MKGFRHTTNFDTFKILQESAIYKLLPYGKWVTTDNKEFLFNRDYEPIAGWDLNLQQQIAVFPSMWIHNIDETKTVNYYGGKTDYPTVSLEVFRKCWDILADWSNRSYLK